MRTRGCDVEKREKERSVSEVRLVRNWPASRRWIKKDRIRRKMVEKSTDHGVLPGLWTRSSW